MSEEAKISSDWQLIHKHTGEIRDIVLFEGKQERWDKVYAKSLASMLDISGDERTKVISYLIRKSNYENKIPETVRSIAAGTSVSTRTVQTVMSLLQEKNYIHKIRNGLYMFSPHVIVTGQKNMGAAVYRSWVNETT